MDKANFGFMGLGVMGQNLVLNMERNGYTVAVHNRTIHTMRDYFGAHTFQRIDKEGTFHAQWS